MLYVSRQSQYRFAFVTWHAKTVKLRQKCNACHFLVLYGPQRWARNVQRIAFSLWRTISAAARTHTIGRLGRSLELALKKLVSVNETTEQQVLSNSVLLERVDALQSTLSLVRAVGSATVSKKWKHRAIRLVFYRWARLISALDAARKMLQAVLRNRHRSEVRRILGMRFLRWKKATEISIIRTMQLNNTEGRIRVMYRRSQLATLAWVWRHWTGRRRRWRDLFTPHLRLIYKDRRRAAMQRAWSRWSSFQRASRMLDVLAARSRRMRAVVAAWQAHTSRQKHARTAAHRRALQQYRGHRRACMMRMLVNWKSLVAAHVLRRKAFRRCLQNLTSSVSLCLQHSFRRWCSAAQNIAQRLRATKLLALQMVSISRASQQRKLVSSFAAWRTLTASYAVDEAQDRLKRACIQSLRQKLRTRPLSRAFHLWARGAAAATLKYSRAEGTFTLAIQQRLRTRCLRRCFSAWLHCERMTTALALRTGGRGGAGLPSMLREALPFSYHYISALHTELSGDRSASVCFRLLCQALREAVPGYLPSLYVISAGGTTLTGTATRSPVDTGAIGSTSNTNLEFDVRKLPYSDKPSIEEAVDANDETIKYLCQCVRDGAIFECKRQSFDFSLMTSSVSDAPVIEEAKVQSHGRGDGRDKVSIAGSKVAEESDSSSDSDDTQSRDDDSDIRSESKHSRSPSSVLLSVSAPVSPPTPAARRPPPQTPPDSRISLIPSSSGPNSRMPPPPDTQGAIYSATRTAALVARAALSLRKPIAPTSNDKAMLSSSPTQQDAEAEIAKEVTNVNTSSQESVPATAHKVPPAPTKSPPRQMPSQAVGRALQLVMQRRAAETSPPPAPPARTSPIRQPPQKKHASPSLHSTEAILGVQNQSAPAETIATALPLQAKGMHPIEHLEAILCPLTYRGRVVGAVALQRQGQSTDTAPSKPQHHWDRRTYQQLRAQKNGPRSRAHVHWSSSDDDEEEAQEQDVRTRHHMDRRTRLLLTYLCTQLHLPLAQASNLASVLHLATHTMGAYFYSAANRSAGHGMPPSRKMLLTQATTEAQEVQTQLQAQQQIQSEVLQRREASLLRYRDQVASLTTERETLQEEVREAQLALRAQAEQSLEQSRALEQQLQQTERISRKAQDRALRAEQELQEMRERLEAIERESGQRLQMLQNTRPVIVHAKQIEAQLHTHQESLGALEAVLRTAEMELLRGED